MVLPALILVLDVLKANGAAQPSFDCAKATGAVPQLICSDTTLAGLDREMAARYQASLQTQPADPAARQHQERWLASRDACAPAAAQDARTCVSAAYQRRITELMVLAGQAPVFATAQYLCAGERAGTLTARYYHTEPAAVLIEYQGMRVVAFVAESGSGARYRADDAELWEHQGTAALRWRGQDLQCPKK